MLRSGLVKAAAHITGGGIPGNVIRVVPDSMAVFVDASSWTVPPVFGWISQMVFYSSVTNGRCFEACWGFAFLTRYRLQMTVSVITGSLRLP